MRIDALATEPHFLDHLAPVWNALPAGMRGTFALSASLGERARRYSIEPGQLAEPRPTLVASYGDQKRVRKLGGRAIARLEHGAGQAYDRLTVGNYAGGEDCSDVLLFLCPNEYSASRWRTAYPEARVDVVGSPRLDGASRGPKDGRPTVAISFHWDLWLLPETRSAFAHYARVLPALAAAGWRVIGHGHPRILGLIASRYRRAGIEVVPDFDDVLEQADVYVCDNSSTLFEFAATGRPVVVLNAPFYRRGVDHGGRFWEWADVGVQVDQPAALVDGIRRAMRDAPEQRRRRVEVVDQVYPIRGRASQAAAEAIAGWLGFHAERSVAA